MQRIKRPNDAAALFVEDLTARIVADSGRPEDRFHLGKMILQSLKDAPDFVLQIDGATGKSETFGSVLERSVRCANAFRKMGLKCGDVIILIAPNHLDLCIPYYAALYLGVAIAPLNTMLKIQELQNTFIIDEPKLVFCQSDKVEEIKRALEISKILAKIVAFDNSPAGIENIIAFQEFMEQYGDGPNAKDFKATDFNPVETISMLITTSGTTGVPKQAAVTHKNFAIGGPRIWIQESNIPTPTKMFFMLSPLQWLTAIVNMNTSPIMRFTRLQSSRPMTPEHARELINTYKPTFLIISPTFLTALVKGGTNKCDFTSFETILVGGSVVSEQLVTDLKKITPKTDVFNAYAMSESSAIVFLWNSHSPRSSGQPAPMFQHRLVDIDRQEDIIDADVSGELWIKGPPVFKGYYKNLEATKEAFTEDGWLKTGDMFYRDEYWNFYFVERIKLLLKYRDHQISPVEIQNLIRQHPGVLDVAVTGIPDKECGDLPVAFVVRRPGHYVSPQEIKDLVKDNLTDTKQLRGGVIFMDAIPMTPTTKVDYKQLREKAAEMARK